MYFKRHHLNPSRDIKFHIETPNTKVVISNSYKFCNLTSTQKLNDPNSDIKIHVLWLTAANEY